MNLLIFIGSLSSGGAERVTANLANYWAAKPQLQVAILAGEITEVPDGDRKAQEPHPG